MDTILQAQFARIDAALGTLVESISTYNPSVQAATALVAADDDLSEGLDQLSYHQSNHARILALRAEAAALETQLKASITTLATLRHELFDTRTSAIPPNARDVPLDQLLSFARNIASHTVPPSHREPIPADDTDPDKEKDKPAAAEDASPAIPSNGTGTPALSNAPDAAAAADPAAAPEDQQPPTAANTTLTVTEEQAEFIRRMNEPNGWTPWPNIGKIHSGNLMFIQANWLDYGKDPWKEDLDGGVVAAEKQEDGVDTDRQQREEREEEERRKRAAQQQQQQQQQQQERRAEQGVQFHGFDFDD